MTGKPEVQNTNQRVAAKARTRQKIETAARIAFTSGNYHAVTIRDLAAAIGMSTGAIFSNFESKEEIFTAVMGFNPPLDGPVTRAAPLLLASLITAQEGLARNSQAWLDAQKAIELAQSDLDGDVWAEHLRTVSRVSPDGPSPAASPVVVRRDGAAGV